MNDEIEQVSRETFDKIVFGVMITALISGAGLLLTLGADTLWFIRSVELFIIALVAYTMHLTGRLKVATYVLGLGMVAMLAEIFWNANTLNGFVPYLLIPVVVIISFFFNPKVTLTLAVVLIAALFGIIAFRGQSTVNDILFILPSVGLTLLLALLGMENKRNLTTLGNRLLENRQLLKSRALELMQAQTRVDEMQQRLLELQKQLKVAEKDVVQLRSTVSAENDELYELIQGTVKELNSSIVALEHSVEKIGTPAHINSSHDFMAKTWEQLSRLRALVVNLDELSNIEHDNFVLDYQNIDVEQMVSEIAGTARGLAREKQLEVRHLTTPGLPKLQADPLRLRQVLLHLVNNAVKYTDEGFVEIRAEMDNRQLIIFVSDTGIGLSSEEAELIFEKFGRASGGAFRNREGIGLGLAISRRIVDLHGGRMWVTSVKGEGSTFYLSLPVQATAQKTRAAVITSKSTMRLGKLQTGGVLVNAQSNGDTVSLPAASTLTNVTDPGATLPFPKSRPTTAQEDLRGLTIPMAGRTGRKGGQSTQLQPIHRYQPMYIQRFGFILLGMLAIVLVVVAILAGVYGSVKVDGSADTTLVTVPVVTPGNVDAVVVVDTATPLPSSTPAQEMIVLPTIAPPSPTSTIEPTEVPLPTPVPPSPTPVSTLPPTPAPTVSIPTATATQLRLPTSTPAPTVSAANNVTAIPASALTLSSPAPTLPPPTIAAPVALADTIEQITALQPNLPLETNNSRIGVSPSGQMVFTALPAGNRDIYVTGSTDTAPVNLTQSVTDDMQPAWSPDGQQIAFSSGRTGSFNIFVMNADGTNPVQVTNSLGYDEWPAWSADGRHLVFVSDRDGNEEIYRVDADGRNLLRLTNNSADDWPAAWSPDGRWVVFASNRDGNWNLFVVAATGGEAIRLTSDPADERDPIFAPDGRSIAFAYNGGGNFDVYTLPLSATFFTEVPRANWTQITNTPIDERYPSWGQVVR